MVKKSQVWCKNRYIMEEIQGYWSLNAMANYDYLMALNEAYKCVNNVNKMHENSIEWFVFFHIRGMEEKPTHSGEGFKVIVI